MYTQAKIKKINSDGTVLVSCACTSCNGCKAQLFCNNKSFTEYLALNNKKFLLQEGMSVTLFLPPGKTILSSFMVFAVPLILFPIGYITTKMLGQFNEIICAIGGFAAMAVSFTVMSIVNIRNKKSLMPIICEINNK